MSSREFSQYSVGADACIAPPGSCEFAADYRKNGAICRVDVGIGPYNQKKSSVFLRTPTILCFRYSIDEHEVSSLRKGKKCERNPSGVSFAFDSRPQATVCAAERFRTNKKRHASACLFLLVREMRLELTRRLPHAPQTCLSTYSSTLAYNFRLLSYYTHSFCICQVFYFFLAGCSITFLLALRPDIWYNTSCMYTKEGGRGGCRSFLFRRTMCAEAF